jgi:hypothetical protein
MLDGEPAFVDKGAMLGGACGPFVEPVSPWLLDRGNVGNLRSQTQALRAPA